MIKYYPEDEQNGYTGIKLPMNGRRINSSDSLFNLSRSTEEQAVSNYINLLLTRPGERYMQPRYGIGIQTYLFEPNTTALQSILESTIRTQCAFWLPYIVNHKILVQNGKNLNGLGSDSENAIHIVITFSVTESGANKTIILFEQGGRISYDIE